MVSFFRSYDPVRFLALLFVLLAMRLPMLLGEESIPNLQIDFMNVGERLAHGYSMYAQTWDTLEPFSAGFYWLVNICCGKSFLALQIFSILIVYLQALYLSIICNLNNVYGDRTMLPGFIYVILASCFVDYFYVTPLLLGLTFILPVFHWMFQNLKINSNDELFYLSGVFIGIASMFQFYLSLFLIWHLLYLMLFIKPPLRVYFSTFIGYMMPLIIVWLYYYISGIDSPLLQYLQILKVDGVSEKMLTISSSIIIAIPIIVTFLIGFIYTLSHSRYVNFQYNVIKIMTLYTLFAVVILLLTKNLQPSYLIILLPAASYFGTNYFHHTKSLWFSEIPMGLIIVTIIGLCYGAIHKPMSEIIKINHQKLLVAHEEKFSHLKSKRILVLGADRAPYVYGKPCTPYINWKFSKSIFQSKRDYEKMAEFYIWIKKERPEYIIDQEHLMPIIFRSIPSLNGQYKQTDKEDIYEWVGL